MYSNHTDELVRKFKEEKIVLFLGPYFAESNGYPNYIMALENIIDEYLAESRNIDSSNINLWLKQKDYLRVSEWCSRELRQTKNPEFFEQTISQIYKRTRSIGILYHLAVSLQVSAIVTPNLDNVLAHSFSEKSVLSHLWTDGNGALNTLKNKKLHILYELGVADKPESIILTKSKYADVIKQNCWKEYYQTVFSEYISLFIGFEPNDPLFQNWIEFCENNVSQPKPWYAFFVPNHDSSFQVPDNLRVIPCDATIDDKIDTSKKVVFYQSFLTDIIELTIGHGKAYSLLSYNAASDWYKLDGDLIKSEKQKSGPEFFYHGGKPGWKIIVDDLDARRDLESEIKSFLRVQELRVSLLTAPAGEGKSTLAYRVAYDFWKNEGFDIFWVDNPYRFPKDLVNKLQKYQDKDVLVVVNRAQNLSDIHLRIKRWKKNSYVRLRILLIGRTLEVKQGALRLSEIKQELPYKEFKLSWISPTEAERVVSKLRQHDQLGILKDLPLSQQTEYFYDTGKGDLLATLLQCIDGDDLSKTVASVCKSVSALPDGDFMLKAYSIVAALNRWEIECSTRLFLQTIGIKRDDIYDRLLEKLPGELDLNVYRQFVETRHTAIAKAACKFLFNTKNSLVDEMEIYKDILEAVGKLGESFENKLFTIIPIRFKENNEIGKARILFQKATETNPSNSPSWHAWAIMEKEQGNVVRARELFQKATNADPSDVPSWHAWAIMEKEQKNIATARELFQKATNADPSDVPSWHALISMEQEIGNLSKVEQLTKEACNAGISEEELNMPERKKPISEDDKIEEKDFGLIEEAASWPFTPRWVTDNLDFGDMRIIAYLLAGLATRLKMAVVLVEIRNNIPELLHPVDRTLFYPDFCKNLFEEKKLIDWNDHPCKKDMRKRAVEIYKEFEENRRDIKPIIKECHLGFRSIYYPIVIDGVMLGFFIIGKIEQPADEQIEQWIPKRKEFIDELRRNSEYFEIDCLKEAEESLNKIISDQDKNEGWTKKRLEYFFNNKVLRGLSRVKEVVEIIHSDKRYEKESEFFASLNKDLVLPSSKKDAKVDLRTLLQNALTKLKQYLNAAFVGLFLGMEPRDRYLPLVGIALNNHDNNSDMPQIYLDKKKAKMPDEVLSDSAWQFEHFQQDVLEKAIKGNDMNLVKNMSLVVAFSHLGHIGALMIGPLQKKGTERQIASLKQLCFGFGLQATGLYLLGEYSSRRETELLGYSLFVHSLRSSAHLDINILKFLKRFVDKKETDWNRAIEAVDDLSKSNKFMGQQIRESLETSSGMSVIQAILNESDSQENSIFTNTPLLLIPLVKNIIERHLPKAKVKQINLTLDKNQFRGVSPQVSPFFLEKMIAVLIDNAILHGREGCCVVINWHKTNNKFIRFEVAGTGQRITSERQDNLWEFGQRKKQEDTTVHGLHIIRKAAEAWGGSAGNSTRECDPFEKDFQKHTFWFTFPLKP